MYIVAEQGHRSVHYKCPAKVFFESKHKIKCERRHFYLYKNDTERIVKVNQFYDFFGYYLISEEITIKIEGEFTKVNYLRYTNNPNSCIDFKIKGNTYRVLRYPGNEITMHLGESQIARIYNIENAAQRYLRGIEFNNDIPVELITALDFLTIIVLYTFDEPNSKSVYKIPLIGGTLIRLNKNWKPS
jgi:hypothetical protein